MVNEIVLHKTWGEGIINSFEDNKIIVSFETVGEKILSFPMAFEKGIIQLSDAKKHSEVILNIEKEFEAIENQKKNELERKKFEEKKLVKKKNSQYESNKASFSKRKTEEITREGNERLYFFVFQGSSYQAEKNGQYIWAPIENEKGQSMHHWERMLDVEVGDIILHGVDTMISAISIAKSNAYSSIRPSGYGDDQWISEGRKIDLDYIILKRPLPTKDFIDEIKMFRNQKYSPFNVKGTGNMGYLFSINPQLVKVFVEWIVKYNPNVKNIEGISDLLN